VGIQLIQEKAIKGDDAIIIGIPCTGVINSKKMKQMFGNHTGNISIQENGENYIIEINNKKIQVLKQELVFEDCITCEY